MNRNFILAAGVTAAALLAGTLIPGAIAVAAPQGQTVYMAPPTSGFGGPNRPLRARVIPWSYADSRPGVTGGQATGLFIWHDRNTVHVESTDNHWFGDDFRGSIEIIGGKFDNVYNERGRADTRITQPSPNRLFFHFNAKDGDVEAFKFNIHDGRRLIFHIGQDGHPTARIYYGQARTPSNGDPVVFDLNR